MPSAVNRIFEGFTSPWDNVAALRMVQGVGQTGRDPGHGRQSVRLLRISRAGIRRIDAGVLGGSDGVEIPEQITSRATRPADPAAMLEDGCEGRTTQERHADELKSSVIDYGMRQDLDDVGVPCPCKKPWFTRWSS